MTAPPPIPLEIQTTASNSGATYNGEYPTDWQTGSLTAVEVFIRDSGGELTHHATISSPPVWSDDCEVPDPCLIDPDSCDPCLIDPDSCDPCLIDPDSCDPCLIDPDSCDPCLIDPDSCDPCLIDPDSCDSCLITNSCDPCLIDPDSCLTYCDFIKPSFGTSAVGRTFPIYANFLIPDSSRLYDITVSVGGPNLSKRTVYHKTAQKNPQTQFEVQVSPPGIGLYEYEWEIEWHFSVAVETAWEQQWDDWRNRNRDTHLPHLANKFGSFPPAPGRKPPQPTKYSDSRHYHVTSEEVEDDLTTPDVNESRPERGYWHGPHEITAAWSTWKPIWDVWSAEHTAWWAHANSIDENPRPGVANPMNMGEWPPSPGTPYAFNYYHSAFDGNGGSVTRADSGESGEFDQKFESHPNEGTDFCSGQQLVITEPVCSSVSGFDANVGETRSVVSGFYTNPNTSPVAALDVLLVYFTIHGANYHAPVSGTGPAIDLPPGLTTGYTGSPTRHNLPGQYSATWQLEWQKIWGDSPGTWPQTIDRVYGLAIACSGGGVEIHAAPPSCGVEFHQWEVEPRIFSAAQSQIVVEIILYNPNLVPIAVNAAGYTIDFTNPGRESGSSFPGQNPPGPAAGIHYLTSQPVDKVYPASSPNYIPARVGGKAGQITLVSNKHPHPNPGQYGYRWNIGSFLGIDSWATNYCSETLRLAYLPYLKVYGGDVSVGGRFGTSLGHDACGTDAFIGDSTSAVGGGRVFGFTKYSGLSSIGASAEYALRAFGRVQGLYSASQKTDGSTQPPTGLTFANDSQAVDPSHWSVDGGLFGYDPLPGNWLDGTNTGDSFANRHCISNYWNTIDRNQQTGIIPSGLTSLDLSDPAAAPEDARLYRQGDLEIVSSSPALETNIAVFVEGDIFIKSDIKNNDDNPIWTGYERRNIGSVYLIAKGNIYIDRTVRQVDAILVAIPPDELNPADKGVVYTCSLGRQTNFGSSHHDECQSQLVVNGAVIARSLGLGRTNGSRNLAQPFEHPDGSQHANNVAEIFYFSPEYYVGLPVSTAIESDGDGEQYYRADSIISLPPLF